MVGAAVHEDAEAPPRFARLRPEGPGVTATELTSDLDLGVLAPPDRPYVVLNMVASADGKATLGGKTKGLGNEADRELFHELRARADAVMVGAGTLREERYGRIVRDPERRERRVRAGHAADPLAVLVSSRLALPADLPLLAVAEQPVVAITDSDGDLEGAAAPVEYLRGVGLPEALRRLRTDHGARSVLCEGGPTLNAELLRDGLVDELFLCCAPKLLGGSGLTIVAGEALPEAVELEPVWVLESGGHLFLRLRVQR